MDHRKLGLRVYVAASGYPVAFTLAGRLVERMSETATVLECRVYPYRKFESCFGLWLELSGPDQGAAFDRLRVTFAPGWTGVDGPGDRSLVWDQRTHGGVAVTPEAFWMNLELWGEADGG